MVIIININKLNNCIIVNITTTFNKILKLKLYQNY